MKNNLSKTFFKLYPIIYKLAWKENIVLSFVDIFHGMSFALVIIITQIFFDYTAEYIRGNNNSNSVIKFAVILILCQVLSQVLNGFVNFYADVVKEKGYGKLCLLMQKKIANISPINFEKNSFLDDINKAEQGAKQACAMVDIVNSIFTFYIPYFALMAIYMHKLNHILILIILLVFVPVLITNYIKLNYSDSIEREIAPLRREAEVYEKTLTSLSFYQETRVLSASRYFINLYKKSVIEWNCIAWKKKKIEAVINIGLSIFSFAAYGIILIMLVYMCLKGKISVGSFAAVFSSVDVMFYLMDEIFKDSMGNIARNMGLINNFLNLLNYPESVQKSIKIADNKISLRNITFMYPGATKLGLDSVSLDIEANETVAIVGANGAGKTTLAKIISGIYLPKQGDVIIGGKKINSEQNAFEYISAVFQKFNRYKLNISESIIISDFNEKKSYIDSLHKVDEYMNVDESIILSRDFGGIDLSGGQWQKIAVARGIHKKFEILILDEPTAAIDPVQESDLYDSFIKISENRTSIIITHRLGLAKISDKIFVMKNGKIVERGKHQELIEKKDEYYRLWISQAKWYEKNNTD